MLADAIVRHRWWIALSLLAIAILAPIAAAFLQAALSRSREYEADRRGARLLGDGCRLGEARLRLMNPRL